MAKYTLYCPETATYMYAHSEDERDILCTDGLILDVTGDRFHEEMALDALGPFDEGANEKAEYKALFTALQDAIDERFARAHYENDLKD